MNLVLNTENFFQDGRKRDGKLTQKLSSKTPAKKHLPFLPQSEKNKKVGYLIKFH